MSDPRDYGLLLLCCLLLYLPGQTGLPVFDRDEARYTQASRQMHETGDYLDIRFQDRPRYQKPVGIYWLQNAVLALGADPGRIRPYRVPSWAGISLAVLLTARLGGRLFGPLTGTGGALLLASALLTLVQARLATTDGALLACVTLAMERLAAAWFGTGRLRGWAWFWLALAAGILIKGPIILLVVGSCLLALRLRGPLGPGWRRLRPLPGVLLLLALVLPWFIAISWHGGGEFWRASVGGDLLPEVGSAQQSHGAPPGTHALMVWVAFWPGGLLLALGLPWIWRQRRDSRVGFLLGWLLPAWLVFELAPTKLPHYVLPLYPALALLSAAAWVHGPALPGKTRRRIALPWLLGGVLIPPGLMLAHSYLGGTRGAVLLSGLGGVAVSGLAWYAWRAVARHDPRAPWRLALLGGGFALVGLGWLLPAAPAFWLSSAVQQSLRNLDGLGCPRPRLLALDYHEPSLVFLMGTDTWLADTDETGVQTFLAGGHCRLALLPVERWTPSLQSTTQRLAIIRGFHYSKGNWLEMALIQRRGVPARLRHWPDDDTRVVAIPHSPAQALADAPGHRQRPQRRLAPHPGRLAAAHAGQEMLQLEPQQILPLPAHGLHPLHRETVAHLTVVDAERLAGVVQAEITSPLVDPDPALGGLGQPARAQLGAGAVGEAELGAGHIPVGSQHRRAGGPQHRHRAGMQAQHDVDIVDHQVQHHVHVQSPLPAGAMAHRLDMPDLPTPGGQQAQHRIEALQMSHLQHHPVAPGQPHQFPGLRHGLGDGLLQQAMPAPGQTVMGDGVVMHRGHRDAQRLHGVHQSLQPPVERHPEALRQPLAAFHVDIVDAHQPGARQYPVFLGVEGAEVAHAHHPHPHRHD